MNVKKIVQRNERGQTLLEFALVAPLLIFFVLALVDFGIAIDRKLVLDHAVREGARFASVGGDALNGNPATALAVEEYTERQSQDVADSTGGSTSDNYISVCYSDTNQNGNWGDAGDEVRVDVHYVHDFVTGFTSIFNTGIANITMDPSASARVEQQLVSPGTVDHCS